MFFSATKVIGLGLYCP